MRRHVQWWSHIGDISSNARDFGGKRTKLACFAQKAAYNATARPADERRATRRKERFKAAGGRIRLRRHCLQSRTSPAGGDCLLDDVQLREFEGRRELAAGSAWWIPKENRRGCRFRRDRRQMCAHAAASENDVRSGGFSWPSGLRDGGACRDRDGSRSWFGGSKEAAQASGGGSQSALASAGFRNVRLLADREGLRFVEGFKKAD